MPYWTADQQVAKFNLGCALAHENTARMIYHRESRATNASIGTTDRELFDTCLENERLAQRAYYDAIDKRMEALVLFVEACGGGVMIVRDLRDRKRQVLKGNEA